MQGAVVLAAPQGGILFSDLTPGLLVQRIWWYEVQRSVIVCLSQLFQPGRKTIEFILHTRKTWPQALDQRGNAFQHKVKGIDITHDISKTHVFVEYGGRFRQHDRWTQLG
jgi:hypothetical protein